MVLLRNFHSAQQVVEWAGSIKFTCLHAYVNNHQILVRQIYLKHKWYSIMNTQSDMKLTFVNYLY